MNNVLPRHSSSANCSFSGRPFIASGPRPFLSQRVNSESFVSKRFFCSRYSAVLTPRCVLRYHLLCRAQKSEIDTDDEAVSPVALETLRKAGNDDDSNDTPKPKGQRKEPKFPVVRYLHRVLRLMLRISRPTLNKQGMLAMKFLVGCSFLFVSTLMLLAGNAGPGARAKRFQPPREVVYSQFLRMIDTGNVRAVRFDDSAQRIYFDAREAKQVTNSRKTASPSPQSTVISNPTARGPTPRQYYTKRISDPSLITSLTKAGVEFGAMQTTLMSALSRVLCTVMVVWLPLLPLYFIMRKVMDNRMGSKKRSEAVRPGSPVVTFADVAGVDSAKEELMEVVACLRDARRYAKLNARMPSGVLLCGPPGTGKTLLAKAVAGEAGVPFFAASASEFVELFVGRGAARIRDLFRESRKNSPCVVFIDELDAIGGRRGMSMNEERDQTLNQLLTELDGFQERTGVLLLAATNRPEVLDPALTRPGRLSRKVLIPLPDERGRNDILSVHLRRVPMESPAMKALAAENIARVTSGFSGAELANVVNEAALMAGRKSQDIITIRELVEGVQRTKFGVNGGGVLLPARGLSRRIMDWAIDVMAGNKAQVSTAQTMG